MMALKTSASPGSAGEVAAGAIKPLLFDGLTDVEVNRQAGADGAAGVGEPNHVVSGGEAGDVADHDRVAEPIGNIGKADRRAAVAIVPDAAVIWSAAPADSGNGAIGARDGGGRGF